MSKAIHPSLAPEQLSINISDSILPFETTSELTPYNGVLGQDRAVSAIQFGVAWTDQAITFTSWVIQAQEEALT